MMSLRLWRADTWGQPRTLEHFEKSEVRLVKAV
jgi:hypothetical protein